MHKIKKITKDVPEGKEELRAVLLTPATDDKPARVVATDSYKLIEVESTALGHAVSAPALIPADYFKAGDTIADDENGKPVIIRKDGARFTPDTLPAEKFPEYQQVMPDKDRPAATVSVNRQYLIDLLEAMPEDTTSTTDEIELSVSTESNHKAVLITNKHATGVLMPLNK